MKKFNLVSNIVLAILALVAVLMAGYVLFVFFGIEVALTALRRIFYMVAPIVVIIAIIKNHKKTKGVATKK